MLKSLLNSLTRTQNAPAKLNEDDSKCMLSGKAITMINVLVILQDMASKLDAFFKFQSISILAIRSNRRLEAVSVASDSL